MASTVLISFIGKGRVPAPRETPAEGQLSPTGYVRTTYLFPAVRNLRARSVTKALFGAAFYRYRLETEAPVDRWLVMGTAQANWADLIEVLPAEPEDLTSLYCEVQDAVQAGRMTETLLNQWQEALNGHLAPAECCLRLVGPGDTEASQQTQWQAMVDAVGPQDRVLLDITHSYRHHPVLAGFMVMLLRWLRKLREVDLYYGAYELASNAQRVRNESPVLHLPLCNTLLEATEAVATYRHTGNYVELAGSLGLSRRSVQHVHTLRFREQTNREHLEAIRAFLETLEQEPSSPLRAGLTPLLHEALQWSAGADLAERMKRRVDQAYRHRNYFEATALLWEALRVAGCLCYSDLAHQSLDTHQARDEAEARMRRQADTVFGNPRADCELFKQLEDLRNAVVHGTKPRSPEVRKALQGPDHFAALFNQGRTLLKQLLETCRTCAASTSPPA